VRVPDPMGSPPVFGLKLKNFNTRSLRLFPIVVSGKKNAHFSKLNPTIQALKVRKSANMMIPFYEWTF
jgi:hypothetical protein